MPAWARSARAEQDLLEIWLYIAADSPTAADRQRDRIDTAFAVSAANPELGPARPDLAPAMRYFVVGSDLILYQQTDAGIEIVRVVHGARYLSALI